MPHALRRHAEGGDVEYTHVVARGRFHHDKERYLYAPAKSGLGWHVYTPLEFAPRRIVWVNRGFVPDELKSPQSRPGGDAPDGQAGIAGIVRLPPQPGLFTPAERFRPQSLVLAGRCRHDGVRVRRRSRSKQRPFTIDADASPDPGARPRGGTTRIDLPNRHLEYALTWYGLALTLIGVYAAFVVSRLRNSSGA